MTDWNKPLRTHTSKNPVELLAGPRKHGIYEYIWASISGAVPKTINTAYVENVPESRYLTNSEMIQLVEERRLLKYSPSEVHLVTGYREKDDGTVCVYLCGMRWSAKELYEKWTYLDGSKIESSDV